MTDEEKRIAELVRKALERIKTLNDPQKIINFHVNVQANTLIDREQREMLTEAIVQQLWTVSPRAATARLGQKDMEGRAFLKKLYDEMSSTLDLRHNRVKNDVKTGGYMISGQRHIDVYLSYKNDQGVNTHLSWIQETPKDERYIELAVRQVGGENAGYLQGPEIFKVGEEEAAAAQYRAAVERALGIV